MEIKIAIAFVVVTMMLCVTTCFVDYTEASSSQSIVVQDGIGNEITLDEVPEHIIGIGKGVNATLIRLGVADKIVVCDSYSTTSATEHELDILDQMLSEGKLLADGNIYSSGKTQLLANCAYATEAAFGFDKEKDVIIITGSESYVKGIVDTLRNDGFKNIAVWYDIKTYDDLCDYVEVVSKIATGRISNEVSEMRLLPTIIANALENVEKRDAVYITSYSTDNFKVNNIGSLAGSMIVAAGGNTFTVDDSQTKPTYTTTVANLFSGNQHSNAVVFVDNGIVKNQENMNKLISNLPSTVTVVGLESLWNNFDIESMDGVKAMAEAMYPEIFDYSPSDSPNASDDNYLYYVIAAIVVVAIIAIGYLIYIKK